MKADGRNGSFQFVSNGIDKAIVLFVAANFANQKSGVEYEAGSDRAKKDDPEKNLNIMLPIQNDPAEADGNCNRGQHHPERKKENEFAAPAYAHAEILAR